MATNRKSRTIAVPRDKGMVRNFVARLKLILRLMGDRRVSTWVKLIPIGALVYMISPIDLIPNAIVPIVGMLDDATVLWIGSTLFVELCPPAVVQEHSQQLNINAQDTSEEVVDAEATDIDDK